MRISKGRDVTRTRLAFQALEARDVPAAYDLGAATDFNLVAFNDIDVFNSDVEGRVAVGHDAAVKSYGMGDKLTNSHGTRDDLIVGHDLAFQYGQVFNGNIVHGNSGILDGVGTPNGTSRQQANVLDFAAMSTDLTAKSALWGAEAPNGRTWERHDNIYMRGMHPTLDIFTLTPAQLDGAKSITLKVPATATVLINVPGGTADIKNLGLRLVGADCDRLVWNFPDATEVNVSGVGLEGSFLAPHAQFNFNNGQIEGTVIADSFAGNGELHLCPSHINIVIPEFSTLRGFVFVDVDKNHTYDGAIDGLQDGAAVYLTGTDSLGRHINRFYLTSGGGEFNYGHLWAGTYSVRVTPPKKYFDSVELGIPGTVNGSPAGSPAENRVNAITLGIGDDGLDYQLPLVNVRG